MQIFTLSAFLLLTVVSNAKSEKQIKLEDIERDNLKSAYQAKIEKNQEQYTQQQQQVSAVYSQQQYDPQQAQQYYNQYQSAYAAYPQQYLQQAAAYAGNYAPLASNSIGAGYQTPVSVHPFQAYFGPTLSRQGMVPTGGQGQTYVMAISAPALAALQQSYYPSTGLSYMPGQTTAASQQPQFYYTAQPTAAQPQYVFAPQTSNQGATAALLYSPSQQYQPSYVPAFSPLSTNKLGSGYTPQYLASTAPQTFTQQSFQDLYSSTPVQTQQPTFVSIKAPTSLVASPNQQQQFTQSTISPLQTKYLNSPQYLAQNYNTIQQNQLKSAYITGVKSTVSPPLKVTPNTNGFFPTNGVAYQNYRSQLAGK